KEAPKVWGLLSEVRFWMALPVQLESELELPRVVGRRGLARAADAARGRIAQLVHGKNVCVIEKVEPIGDQVQPEALAKTDAFGDTQVELEETRHPKGIPAKAANAPVGRRDAGNRERRAVGQQACRSVNKSHALNVGRCCGAGRSRSDNRRTILRRAEVEARILAGDHVVGTSRRYFHQGRKCEVAQEAIEEALAGLMGRGLEDGAGDPAMPLVIVGIGSLQTREAAVLRLQRGLQV